MLNPTRSRQNLPVLHLGAGYNPGRMVENQAASAGSALVDRCDVFFGHGATPRLSPAGRPKAPRLVDYQIERLNRIGSQAIYHLEGDAEFTGGFRSPRERSRIPIKRQPVRQRSAGVGP